jgi:hypothetical protein
VLALGQGQNDMDCSTDGVLQYMKLMKAELDKRERERNDMFAKVRARQAKYVEASTDVFEKQAEEERKLAERIAKAQEEADLAREEDLRQRAARRAQFKRDLRRTVDAQLQEKQERRQAEHDEAMATAARARAAAEDAAREERERDEKRRRDLEATREVLDAQHRERVQMAIAGMSQMEQEVNRQLLAQMAAEGR